MRNLTVVKIVYFKTDSIGPHECLGPYITNPVKASDRYLCTELKQMNKGGIERIRGKEVLRRLEDKFYFLLLKWFKDINYCLDKNDVNCSLQRIVAVIDNMWTTPTTLCDSSDTPHIASLSLCLNHKSHILTAVRCLKTFLLFNSEGTCYILLHTRI